MDISDFKGLNLGQIFFPVIENILLDAVHTEIPIFGILVQHPNELMLIPKVNTGKV